MKLPFIKILTYKTAIPPGDALFCAKFYRMYSIKPSLKIAAGIILFLFLSVSVTTAQSSREIPRDWHLLNYQQDSVYGTGVTRAYQQLLGGKKSRPVIVAVIDSGVDTAQEDLKGHIWTNFREVPGNDKDDDHNGYTDDIHGWNFLGGKNDTSIGKESSALDRAWFRLREEYGSVADSAQVKEKDRADYRYWLNIKQKRYQDSLNNAGKYATISNALERFDEIDSLLRLHIKKDTIRLDDVKNLQTDNDTLKMMQMIALRILNEANPQSLEEVIADGKEYVSGLKYQLDNMNNDPNAERRAIVGDNINDIKDRDYGNNDITGHFDRHATHVSGIIAASRNNGIGMDGIANNVIILPVKAVPDGDERDKDVALAIRYAVDNGAQIINMSFGKGYSSHKEWVDEAVKYAEKHDVLLVHAAGNDGADDDSVANYPNPDFLDSHSRADNFITVGASGPTNDDRHLAASFSNYGKKEVDVFAPGVRIYSTLPGNTYGAMDGTSMATPVVAGIAALILEYYPNLSARQLKYVIVHSALKLDSVQVIKPGTEDELVNFSTLSQSGGIIDAYSALKLAATLKGERKISRKEKREMKMIEMR